MGPPPLSPQLGASPCSLSVSPFQTWMNVPPGWPSVLTAASTPRDPLSVYATQAMSWVPTAGSATVSWQWTGGAPGANVAPQDPEVSFSWAALGVGPQGLVRECWTLSHIPAV